MRRLTTILTAMTLALALNNLSAAMGSDRISVNLEAGAAINVASGERSDLFPSGFAASGDLYYRINPNLSFVPVSLAWHVYNYDQVTNSVTQGVLARVPGDIGDTTPDVVDIDGSAWGVGYLPGLYLRTNSDYKFDLFGQAGVGAYFYKESLRAFNVEEETDETSFAARASIGLDYELTTRSDMRLRTGYLWIDTDHARDGLVEFSVGLNVMF